MLSGLPAPPPHQELQQHNSKSLVAEQRFIERSMTMSFPPRKKNTKVLPSSDAKDPTACLISIEHSWKWSRIRTHPIFTLSFLCVAVAVVTTFAPPPVGVNTGRDPECVGHEGSLAVCICPRSTVCAKNLSSVVFLVLARASAYFDYPLYVALFFVKGTQPPRVSATHICF